MKQVVVLTLLSFFLFWSCSSSKPAQESEAEEVIPKPGWVTSRPMRKDFYIGIAVVNKNHFPGTYAEEARKLALQDMASEIDVDIESTSMLFTFENNQGGFRDEYRSYARMTTNKQLRRFELEDIYETDEKYWVYYSLSKAVYQKDKNERMEKALSNSKQFVTEAQELKKKSRYRDAFVQYMRALRAVEEFAGEPLRTEYNGSEVFWGNALPAEINGFAASLQFDNAGSQREVLWGLAPQNEAVTAVLRDVNGNTVAGIPVRITYSEGFIRPRISLTNVRGEVTANLTKIREKKEQQKLTFTVDLLEMFNAAEGEPADNFMEELIERISAPRKERSLHVQAPRIMVQYTAQLPRGVIADQSPEQAAVERLNKLGFRVVTNESTADLVFDVRVSAKLLEPMADMHRCDITVNLVVKELRRGETLYNETLPNIRGVQLSDAAAAQNGIYKTADELNEVAVPRFYRSLLK